MKSIHLQWSLCISLAALLGSCASLPQHQDLSSIHSMVEKRAGVVGIWASGDNPDSLANELLKQPLNAENAVQIALLHNPRMRSEYARLGIAQADVYEASRISNPVFSVTSLDPQRNGESRKIDAGISQNFADLLLLPVRKRLAQGEYERTQQSIAAAIFNLAVEVRAGWYRYVGAQQTAAMRDAVAKAAQASAGLAGKFREAGNISALQLSIEEAAATQARLQAARARAEAISARFGLDQLLGLVATDEMPNADYRLPEPVAEEDVLETLAALAREQRLDLIVARKEVALLEQNVATAKRYRWLGRIDAGVSIEREPDRAKLYGPSLSLQLPIFNQGQGAVARAGALLDDARARLQSLELAIDSSVQSGLQRVLANRKIVEEYRTELIPQREDALSHTQQSVNFMLVGVFELIVAKQQEYDAYQGYLEALRDYWLARVDLMRAVGARLPSDAAAGRREIDTQRAVGRSDKEGELHDDHAMPPEILGQHDHHGGKP